MSMNYGATPQVQDDTEGGYEGPGYTFLRFHHPASANAAYVIKDLGPGIKLGTPLLASKVVVEGETDDKGRPLLEPMHVDVSACKFFVLTGYQYWVAKPTTLPYDPVGAWTTRQDFKAKYKGCKVREAFVAQVLVLTADGPVIALAECLGPKAVWMKQACKAQRHADSKEFKKSNARLLKKTADCPGLRVTGRFVVKPKSGDFGPWCYVEGEYDPTSEQEWSEFQSWIGNRDYDAVRAALGDLYSQKVEDVIALANTTPAL